MVRLKRTIIFYKRAKKLELKTIRTKLKNIISSIWIEWWNYTPIKFLQKDQIKKWEIQKIKNKLENMIFGKLGFNDEIENK